MEFWAGLIIGIVVGVLAILGFGYLFCLVMDHFDEDDDIDYWREE